MTLEQLLPDEDYGFRLRFNQGTIAEFFQPTEEHDQLIAERRRWLESKPSTCLGLLPEGVAPLTKALAFLNSNGVATHDSDASEVRAANPIERLRGAGRCLEPDFLILRPTAEGKLLLVAGCVCFPSSWSLEEKLGLPIEEIHGVVPGLNAAIGPQITRFLSHLRPGIGWLRANWGLSRSPELNQHPARNLPRLDDSATVEDVWLRVEEQLLTSVPDGIGVFFGIRIKLYPLVKIATNRPLASRLTRALETMPEQMARYKGLAGARPRILTLLEK